MEPLSSDAFGSIVLAFAAAFAAFAGGLVAWLIRERSRREQRRLDVELELMRRLRNQVMHGLPTSAAPSDTATSLMERLELLEARLELIEKRLPAEATLDKFANINDAVLAARIEELQRSMSRVENGTMTPGRVTTIVFGVIAAFFGLAAILPWIVERLAAI